MGLDGALSIASGSLANINARLNLVSNNVANAATPDYSVETSTQESLVAGTQGLGARTGAATRAIDLALQQSVFQQGATVTGLTTTTGGLSAVDAVLGTPGQGNDLGSLLGNVRDAFSALLGDPSSGSRQATAVSAAGTLAGGINALSEAYTQQRQTAQNDIVGMVTTMNTRLSQIGVLSNHIVAARSGGQSTADLENQRDASVHALSNVLGIKTLNQPNGDLIVTTGSGTQLPTRAATGPVVTSAATLGAGAYYPGGGLPPITVNGIDITTRIQGGQLGADIALRDTTLPTFQAELDEFSFSLAARFDAQGLTLFTDPNGDVPAGGGAPVQSSYTGFAAAIQVNPAVATNVTLARDGTRDVGGSATGAANFTVNPPGGPAGFTALIGRVLTFALGAQAQSGVAQRAGATLGLGPAGNLSAPYGPSGTLADHAAAMVSAQAAVSATAARQLSIEQAVQTTLTNNLTASSGVNMDTEMSHMIQLQNAYGANARIIAAVQALFAELLQAVR
ncbi:MAG: hypothetical protein EXR07_16470 [Acetobacteraceae bacterium]|nr:hypothetical protein [Acetobacteraceae bacterium]